MVDAGSVEVSIMSGVIQWPAPNIKALYHLADVNDSSGNGYNLTNNGTVTFAIGKFGNCGVFADSKFLSIVNTFGINPSSDAYSMGVWLKPTSQPSSGVYKCIMSIEKASNRGAHIFYINDSGTYKLIVSYNNEAATLSYTVTLVNDIWYHLVFTGSAAGAGTLYLNGAKVATGSRTTDSNPPADSFGIGEGWYGEQKYWAGGLDEAAVWNVELTAQQIRRLYAFQRGMMI